MTVTQYMITYHSPTLALMEELAQHFGDLELTEEEWQVEILAYLSK